MKKKKLPQIAGLSEEDVKKIDAAARELLAEAMGRPIDDELEVELALAWQAAQRDLLMDPRRLEDDADSVDIGGGLSIVKAQPPDEVIEGLTEAGFDPLIEIMHQAAKSGDYSAVPEHYREPLRFFASSDNGIVRELGRLTFDGCYPTQLPKRVPQGCCVGIHSVGCAIRANPETKQTESVEVVVNLDGHLTIRLEDLKLAEEIGRSLAIWQTVPTSESVAFESIELHLHPFVAGLARVQWQCSLPIGEVTTIYQLPVNGIARRVVEQSTSLSMLFQERIFSLIGSFGELEPDPFHL